MKMKITLVSQLQLHFSVLTPHQTLDINQMVSLLSGVITDQFDC